MPTHPFVVSKAVHLAAQPLAGLDPGLVMQLRQILGEEALLISDELQHNGNQVDAQIIAARLDGFVRRLMRDIQDQVCPYWHLPNRSMHRQSLLFKGIGRDASIHEQQALVATDEGAD